MGSVASMPGKAPPGNVNHATIRGSDLAWIERGRGIPILWIHGYPLSSTIFEHQLAIEGFRHVAPDLRGFGASTPPSAGLTIDDYARDCLALLDHLGIASAVVAGLSMGGYVALAFRRIAPHRVNGMIFIDTRASADTDDGRRARAESIAEAETAGTTPLIETMLPLLLASPAPEVVSAVRSIMESASIAGVVAALRAMAARPDSTEMLSSIDVPTLVVVGEHDVITPPDVARRLADSIPGARLVEIAGAGHLTPIESPGPFNRAIVEFSSGCLDGGAP